MISVKEFAFENKVSESIVYRHIRNHKEELGDRVQKAHGRTWLTDEGVNFIKNLMTQQTIVREKANDVVRQLENELRLKNASIEAQANIIKSLERDLIDFEKNKQLLAEHNDKIVALEAKNDDLSHVNEELGQKVAEAKKTAQEVNKTIDVLVNGSYWERRKLRRELKRRTYSQDEVEEIIGKE